MSYVRWSKDSSVYVYQDVGGYLRCCGCSMEPSPFGSFNAKSTAEIVAHLREHQAKGDRVPERVFGSLEEDREENDRWLALSDEDRERDEPDWPGNRT